MSDKKIHPDVIKKLEELGFQLSPKKHGNFFLNLDGVALYADFSEKKEGAFYAYDGRGGRPVLEDNKKTLARPEIVALMRFIKDLDYRVVEWHKVKYEVKIPKKEDDGLYGRPASPPTVAPAHRFAGSAEANRR